MIVPFFIHHVFKPPCCVVMIYFVHPRKILNEALYLIGSGTYMFNKVFYGSVGKQSWKPNPSDFDGILDIR